MRLTGLLLSTLVYGALSAPAAQAVQTTQDGPPLNAHRISEGVDVRLDGNLDEAVWQQATPITDFTTQNPVEGGTPSEPTEIRVLYDADALYIGAVLYDDPSQILAFQKRRDAFLSTDDRFMWVLDTFDDGRTGYFFETNANGLLGDALITSSGGGGGGGGGSSRAWDGIWDVQTTIRPDGWSLEIRIPFRTLNFDPEATTWGINFQRTIRRKNEEILWRGWRRNQSLRQVVHAGRLEGLSGMSQGIGLEAKPYAVGNWKNVPSNEDPTTYPGDMGLDLNYNITPSLKAGVSYNTDFAEAEVDQRRINLTRFPLRFPEVRDFFLEGSGVFSFAARNGVQPYFSRRIGLASGEPVPIDYAARFGGQVGRTEMGFVHVKTGGITTQGDEVLAGEDFTVARIRQSFLQQSTVGAIYTRRATGADPSDAAAIAPDDRHTFGVDLDFFTSTLFGDKNFQAEAFFAWNSNPEPAIDRSLGDLTARGFRLNYPNDIWSAHVSYREFGDDYNPAVGFVTRNDFRRVEPRIGYSPRPESLEWLRQVEWSAQFRHMEGLGTGITLEQQWQLNLLGLEFESQDRLSFGAERLYEFLDDSFEISDGVVVNVGDYRNWTWDVEFRSASRRRVSVDVEASHGGFWSGDRTQFTGGIEFRPTPGIEFGGELEHNDVKLPQGEFSANLFRVEGAWDISPWASVTGNVQYDDVSEVVGLFMRSRWIVQPGNELFLVFTSNWQNLGDGLFDDDREFVTLSRGASIKLNYTYWF